MISLDELIYYPTYGDLLRVCTARNRIFRMIPQSHVSEVREFLASELFSILTRNHYIPKTSISDEVDHEDGELVLEHERLFKTSPNEWSFTQFKDAAIFLLELQELCKKHGYYVADAHLQNIVFDHGHPVFLDFGSFVKGEMDEWYETYWNGYFIEVNYLILSLWSQGQTYVCRSILDEQRWIFSKLVPEQRFEYNVLLMPYLHKMVKKYDIYLKSHMPYLPIHTSFMLSVLHHINYFMQKTLKKPTTWHCFKIHPKYKQCMICDIERLHYHVNATSYYPIEKVDRINEIAQKIINGDVAPRSILLIGNFAIESISYLRSKYDGRITIANDDTIYMDKLYDLIKDKSLDIHTICINALYCSDKDDERLKSDMVICEEAIDNRWAQPKNTMAPGVSRLLVISRLKRLKNDILYPYDYTIQNICGGKARMHLGGGIEDSFADIENALNN